MNLTVMKTPIILSVAMIVIAAGLNWHFDERLAAAHRERTALQAKAAQSGISVEGNRATRSAARPRTDHVADAHRLAREYIRLLKQSANGLPDETSRAAFRDCQKRISELNARGLEILIAELLASEEIDERRRIDQSRSLLRTILAKNHPHAALDFVKEHSAAFHDMHGVGDVISDALGHLAKDDPIAAVEWMKKNAAEFPDAMKAQALSNVFHSTARRDPGLAFTLISELDTDDTDAYIIMYSIVTSARTNEDRSATLAALRKYRDANSQNTELLSTVNRMVGHLSRGFEETGISGAKTWIDSVDLTPEEMRVFCDNLIRNYDGAEHSEWIEWMDATLPSDLSRGPIMNMMRRWTSVDPEAAGNWLASAPEGPAKTAATSSYANAIFGHDPETAMQWIDTLPSGHGRTQTLNTIHRNWPKDDPDGAAAFAMEHGIE